MSDRALGFRRGLTAVSVAALAAACSPGIKKKEKVEDPTPLLETQFAAGFPKGYESWKRANAQPIVRADTNEVRHLYYNSKAMTRTKGPFPVGSVLVKAHHTLDKNGKAGATFQLSVMTKTGEKQNGGWQYRAFNPGNKQEVSADAEVCALCHTQAQKADGVFSAQ